MAETTGNKPTKTRQAASGSFKQGTARSGRSVTAAFAGALPPGVLGKTTLTRAGGSLVATVPAAARKMLHPQKGKA